MKDRYEFRDCEQCEKKQTRCKYMCGVRGGAGIPEEIVNEIFVCKDCYDEKMSIFKDGGQWDAEDKKVN